MPIGDDRLPLTPPDDNPPPGPPATALVALACVWLGLAALVVSVSVPFLPGAQDPRSELEHARPYGLADRVLPLPLYLAAGGLCLAGVVVWATRGGRDLPRALRAQRIQAAVGAALSLAAVGVIYGWVALRGPG
jgi:hypothetical protein